MLHKIDLHVHTEYSGDSPCGVKEAVQTAKRSSLSGIAITDHDSMEGIDEAVEITENEDFLVIPGIEVSSRDGHILGLGLVDPISPGKPASAVVEEIRNQGGIAVAAHPFSLCLKPFSPLNTGFDAIEVFNSRRYVGNKLAKDYALRNQIPMVAGSDAHYCDEIGLAGVEVDTELKVDSVLGKIGDGDSSIFGSLLPPNNYLRRISYRLSKL